MVEVDLAVTDAARSAVIIYFCGQVGLRKCGRILQLVSLRTFGSICNVLSVFVIPRQRFLPCSGDAIVISHTRADGTKSLLSATEDGTANVQAKGRWRKRYNVDVSAEHQPQT